MACRAGGRIGGCLDSGGAPAAVAVSIAACRATRAILQAELEGRLQTLKPLRLKREKAVAAAANQLAAVDSELCSQQLELAATGCLHPGRRRRLRAVIDGLEGRLQAAAAKVDGISRSSQLEAKLADQAADKLAAVSPVRRRAKAAATVEAAEAAEAEHAAALAALAARIGGGDRRRGPPPGLMLMLDDDHAGESDATGLSPVARRGGFSGGRRRGGVSPLSPTLPTPSPGGGDAMPNLRRRGGASPSSPSAAAFSPSTAGGGGGARPAAGRRGGIVSGVMPGVAADVGLTEALRVARSYPPELFEAVFEKELQQAQHRAGQAAAEAQHSTMMEKFKRSGRLTFELAHDGLPRDVRTWDVSAVRAWLVALKCDFELDRLRARGIDGRALIFMSAKGLAKILCAEPLKRKPFKHALRFLRTEVVGLPFEEQPA